MKKWEEQRKRKQYAEKINNAKPTLKTQPKGAKVQLPQYSTRNAAYGPDSDQDMLSHYVSNDMITSAHQFNPGMANTNYTGRMKSQRADGISISIQQASGGGSTYYKPKLRQTGINSNSTQPSNVQRSKTKSISDFSNMRKETIQVTDIPIYHLLKAFKLQQYSLKMNDLGYGHDMYKLALLTQQQREDFVDQLKVMPGHRAKIAGFFSVIDELFPRSVVQEQISAVTPNRAVGRIGAKKGRIQSATRTRYHLGPQKTLLQQYEKLDRITKQAFNNQFLQSLEGVKQTIPQLLSQHVDIEESSRAFNELFPPAHIFGNEQMILEGVSHKGYNQEMEDLVNKFTSGSQISNKYQNQLRHSYGQEHHRKKSKSSERKQKSSSKERKMTEVDKMGQEVERQLKAQRKREKDSIKKFGYVQNQQVNLSNQRPVSGTQRLPSGKVLRPSRSRESTRVIEDIKNQNSESIDIQLNVEDSNNQLES